MKPYLITIVLNLIFVVAAASVPYTKTVVVTPKCGFIVGRQGKEVRQLILPVHYLIDNSVPKHRVSQIRNAARKLNKGVGFEVIRVLGVGDAKRLLGNRVQSIQYVGKNWAQTFEPDQTMVTMMSDVGNLILSSNIYINDFWHGKSSERNFTQVMAHEFGHALGLPHTTEAYDLMYYSDVRGLTPQYKQSFDKLKCAYSTYENNPRKIRVIQNP